MRALTRVLEAAMLTAVLSAATACGSNADPSQAVPGLTADLSRLDRAISVHQRDAARAALDTLVDDTSSARDAGDLNPEQADRILAAAARLRTKLPDLAPASTPEAPTTPSQNETTPAPPTQNPGEGDSEDESGD